MPERAAEVARIMWMRSTLDTKNIDTDSLAYYIGSTYSKSEIESNNLSEVVYSKKIVKKKKQNVRKTLKNLKKSIKITKLQKQTKNEKMKKSQSEKSPKPEIVWMKPKRNAEIAEVKKMFGLALKRLIIVSMRNHVYSFKNEYYLQCQGGSTGLDETGEVADLYMLWWDLMFNSKVKDLGLTLKLFARFKDDCNVISNEIPLEQVYDVKTDKMVSRNTNNLDGSTSPEAHTAEVLKLVANNIDEMISFSTDIPTNYPDNYLPVLDVKVQLSDQNKLFYQFYEKPTKHSKVILADSALNWKQKRTILTQEALRRLRNTSVELGNSVSNEHLTRFMLKMKDSGYSERFRHEVVSSALKAFEKMIENDKKGIKPLHRNRKEMLKDKGAKLSPSYNWWNKSKVKFSSVLFVPPTPNGELLRMMKKRESELNSNNKLRLKILEKGGTKFKDMIVKKNPFKPEPCTYKVCPLCKETKFTLFDEKNVAKCKMANIGYRFICAGCNATYEGESARISRDRALEHIRDLQKNKKESPMVKHLESHHKDEESKPKFKIQITGSFFDALSRQADESVRIKNTPTDKRMNSKAEFNSAPVKRIRLVKT